MSLSAGRFPRGRIMSGYRLLNVNGLVVRFPAPGSGFMGLNKRWVHAVNGVSLSICEGETLGLVGESGSGKSTLGRAILRLNDITSGQIVFDDVDMAQGSGISLQRLRSETAMIFQDPSSSLNPRMTVGATLAEVLKVQRKVSASEIPARVIELLDMVGLRPEFA
ncbi:Peptide ABC transporter ATP-binding protein, partial [Pseudomonas amygdali pv. aesculi]